MTINFIDPEVGLVVSGRIAAPRAMRIYNTIKDKINKGIDLGDDDLGVKTNIDIYVNLIVSSTISTDLDSSFNIVGESKSRRKIRIKK